MPQTYSYNVETLDSPSVAKVHAAATESHTRIYLCKDAISEKIEGTGEYKIASIECRSEYEYTSTEPYHNL